MTDRVPSAAASPVESAADSRPTGDAAGAAPRPAGAAARPRPGADAVRVAAERLVGRVSHWTPARWVGRAERFHALVQQLADLAAASAGRPPRTVPRLDSDLALPDQLRVVVGDLLDECDDPAVLFTAAALITSVLDD
jgi:hypothetical protein